MDRISKLAQQSMFWKMHVSSVIKQSSEYQETLSDVYMQNILKKKPY